ncbi:MAG TPA: hypothetical protein VF403_13230 [Kofleriaceae bacterium]
MGPLMKQGQVHRSPLRIGERFELRSRLFEVRVDLSAAAAQDCPPIFYFAIIASEAGWVREQPPVAGDVIDVGDLLLVATSTDLEPLAATPDRDLRVAVAVIQIDPLFD